MAGLGQALRWLREKQGRKQYRVADNACITKGMLSAYETGRQRPSLETLEKILETLGCDLNDLHNALQIVNGHPERIKSWRGWQTVGWPGLASAGSTGVALGAGGSTGSLSIGEGAPPYGSSPGPEDELTPQSARNADTADTAGTMGNAGKSGNGSNDPNLVDGAPGAPIQGYPASARRTMQPSGWSGDLDSVLGRDRPRLALEEEQALNQMMDGFHCLVRYWHRSLSGLGRRQAAAGRSDPGDPASPANPAHRSRGPKDS
jgi:DNA-binding XRE family transcriptional regulator